MRARCNFIRVIQNWRKKCRKCRVRPEGTFSNKTGIKLQTERHDAENGKTLGKQMGIGVFWELTTRHITCSGHSNKKHIFGKHNSNGTCR